MRSRRLIINHRRQSRIDLPIKSLWYFSESASIDIEPSPRKESSHLENYTQIKADSKQFTSEKNKTSISGSANTFVVDWQISDVT
jgi:hypothetical protein